MLGEVAPEGRPIAPCSTLLALFQQVEHPTEGALLQARPPARFSASPAGVQRLAPRLGEHTREVLREVGYEEAEIEGLVERKAVGVK